MLYYLFIILFITLTINIIAVKIASLKIKEKLQKRQSCTWYLQNNRTSFNITRNNNPNKTRELVSILQE